MTRINIFPSLVFDIIQNICGFRMKAKDMFKTLFSMEDLDKSEFISIIWSNPVEDDFISAMCALMDFVDYKSAKTT